MDTKALQLTPTLCADDLLAIAELYIEAFPAVERRPMRTMIGLLSRDECHFHRIMRGDDTVGLMHLWDLPTVSTLPCSPTCEDTASASGPCTR